MRVVDLRICGPHSFMQWSSAVNAMSGKAGCFQTRGKVGVRQYVELCQFLFLKLEFFLPEKFQAGIYYLGIVVSSLMFLNFL